MPGLVPGIHVWTAVKDVDGRDKPGHDAVARFEVDMDYAGFVAVTM